MSMWKRAGELCVIVLITSTTLLSSCKSTETCREGEKPGLVTGPKGIRKVFVPEYYYYKKGRYEFVEGRERWIINRKAYLKRANRGYAYRDKSNRFQRN